MELGLVLTLYAAWESLSDSGALICFYPHMAKKKN